MIVAYSGYYLTGTVAHASKPTCVSWYDSPTSSTTPPSLRTLITLISGVLTGMQMMAVQSCRDNTERRQKVQRNGVRGGRQERADQTVKRVWLNIKQQTASTIVFKWQ